MPTPRIALTTAIGCMVLAVAAATGAPSPPPGLAYAGDNSQHNLVVLQLNAKRTQVRDVVWLYDAKCTAGPAATPETLLEVSATDQASKIPVNARGVWHTSFTTTFARPDGSKIVFEHTLHGRRSGGTMVGNLRTVGVETDAVGATVRTCDSQPVKFKLFERNVFGGRTAVQLNPIAVTMNPARTRVTRLRWDWQGTCTLGPAKRANTAPDVYYPDLITQLPVDKLGRWGGAFGFPAQPDPATGITTSFDYKITSRRIGTRIRGTITSSFIETDTATGGEIRRCSSGAVRFAIRD